jgi:hypothetical protein
MRPVMSVKAEKWRRKARRTYYDMERNIKGLDMEEWFWLALLVIWGLGRRVDGRRVRSTCLDQSRCTSGNGWNGPNSLRSRDGWQRSAMG